MLEITQSNRKMGAIPALNLLPGPSGSCPANVPCWREGCYAQKPYLRKTCWPIYERNLVFWREDPKEFQDSLFGFLRYRKPALFRFHSFGDIPDPGYLEMMLRTAREHRHILILCFTKRFGWILDAREDILASPNLTVVASMWTGLEAPPMPFPRAWMDDGRDPRIPDDAMICFGKCDACGTCWNLKLLKRDVVFRKH